MAQVVPLSYTPFDPQTSILSHISQFIQSNLVVIALDPHEDREDQKPMRKVEPVSSYLCSKSWPYRRVASSRVAYQVLKIHEKVEDGRI